MRKALFVLIPAAALLAACANNQNTSPAPASSDAAPVAASGRPAVDGGSVAHPYTAEDKAYLSSNVPVKADRLTLYVHGIGCPLCASGVDYAIMKLPGVTSSKLNLATNTVEVTMSGPDRPTPAQFNRAVDADFTLVKIGEAR